MRDRNSSLTSADGNLERRERPALSRRNQFALELDHFAECVRAGRRPYTAGEEGLHDQRVMEAIYTAARTGRLVELGSVTGTKDVFRGAPPT